MAKKKNGAAVTEAPDVEIDPFALKTYICEWCRATVVMDTITFSQSAIFCATCRVHHVPRRFTEVPR